jgi:hypothetical protein
MSGFSDLVSLHYYGIAGKGGILLSRDFLLLHRKQCSLIPGGYSVTERGGFP